MQKMLCAIAALVFAAGTGGLQTPAAQAETFAEMKNSINLRFDRRLDMLSRGVKLWDTEIAHIMSLRGIK